MLWGILGITLALPAWGSEREWKENEAFRDGQTRVWESVKVQEVKNPFTGEISINTVSHHYYEKADGLNYNIGTLKKPQWIPSVESIKATEDPYFPYQADEGPYQVRFGASINQTTPIEYTVGKETLRLGLKYLAYYDKKNGTLKPFKTLNHVNPVMDGNKVIYRDAFSGIDVEYVYQKGVFQQNIKINSKGILGNPETYGISTDDAYLVAVTEIDTTDFSTEFENTQGDKMAQGLLKGEGCDILFKKKGNLLCTLAPSLAYADTEDGKKEINQYRHIYQEGNKQYLLEGVTYQELQNLNAPLTLDYEIKTGGVSSNETWKEGKTYYLSGNVTINSGATLVIEPGAIVKYGSSCKLEAASGGRLIAKGDKFHYILMTSWKDDPVGETISGSDGNPQASNYYCAISLPANTVSDHHVEYCKISYSGYGLIIQTKIDDSIQNNILRNIGLYGFYINRGNGPNGDGVVIRNNLLISNGVGLYANGDDRPVDPVYIDFYNNTLDDAVVGVFINYGYPANCWNNIISNGTYGFYGSDSSADCFHESNKFYDITTPFYGGELSSGYLDEVVAQNPYVTSPNGSYYLDQSNTHVVDASPDIVSDIFKTKTTIKPNEVANDISTDTSWDKVSRDQGHLDVGYHYDPVDVVVGSTSHPIVNIYNANTTANLKIYPGVVVSFWRNLSQNTSRLWLKNGKFVAHGHADDRIQFRNIYETGDMPTYSLGSGDSYGYSYGIEFGSGVEPESYAQFCEFHHACSGILLDPGINKPIYRRFSDNIFNGCQYGMTAIDAYLRAENNLFISSPQSDYQIYYLCTTSACDTAIVRNNTFIGDQSGDCGVYGYQGASSNDYVDSRNNIYTGFKEAAIKLDTIYYTGKISNNCYFNNSTNNIASSISVESAVYRTPQFAWSTASSAYWNGYYLAQTTGDASRTPLVINDLASSNGIEVTGITNGTPLVYAYASNASNAIETLLGTYNDIEYVDESSATGNLLLKISGLGQFDISAGDYIILNMANSSQLKVYLPAATVGEGKEENLYLWLWVASDGSSYYARRSHGSEEIEEPDQDAWYAMSYDTAGLAKDSFSCLGISTCVNSGDTTVRAYGSTASSYSKDSGKIDIGYHPKNPGYIMVAENGRQFEYEDGTAFVASGGAVLWASVEYQDEVTRPVFDKYLKALKDKGVTALTMSFHQNRCFPWGYENDAQTAWAVSTAKGVFSNETAQWLDYYLDSLEKADLKLGLLVWQGSDGYGTISIKTGSSGNDENDYAYYPGPRHHYNPFWSGSTIFHDGSADSTLDIFIKPECFDYQTTTMEYYVDRWGDRESLIYWDPLLETDYYYLTPAQLMGWTANVHRFIKDYELKKYGHRHLVTASTGRPMGCYYRTSPYPSADTSDRPILLMPSMTQSFTGYSNIPNASVLSEDWGSIVTTVQATYFNDPNMDFTCVHFGGDSTLSFPAIDTITQNSLWYPVLGEQWLRDSVGSVLASTTQFWLGRALSTTTAGNRPYFVGLYYPPYFTPWMAENTFRKDDASLVDVGTTLYAISTLLIDRHIAPEFHDMYNYYLNWALTAGGAAGPGFTGSEQVYNMFNTNPGSSFVSNNYHTDYCLDTGYFQDTTLVDMRNNNNREYNTFTTQMLKDKLALYKVMTCVNWNSRTWDNLGGSNRISITGFTNVTPIYSGNSSNMIAYFCRDMQDTTVNYSTSTITNMTVTFSGFPEFTPIYLTWFNPKTGEKISSTSFSEGSIQVTVPPFTRDIVAVLKPE